MVVSRSPINTLNFLLLFSNTLNIKFLNGPVKNLNFECLPMLKKSKVNDPLEFHLTCKNLQIFLYLFDYFDVPKENIEVLLNILIS